MTSPPVIVRGVIVVGSSVFDWWGKRPSPPGDVRGFDVATGQLLWTFHTVPQGEEPGVETWEKDSWKETGNANVWAPMSADEELGYVYLPVSTPTNDYYGGHRPATVSLAKAWSASTPRPARGSGTSSPCITACGITTRPPRRT